MATLWSSEVIRAFTPGRIDAGRSPFASDPMSPPRGSMCSYRCCGVITRPLARTRSGSQVRYICATCEWATARTSTADRIALMQILSAGNYDGETTEARLSRRPLWTTSHTHVPYDARNTRTPAAALRRSAARSGIASSPKSMARFNGSPMINQLNCEAATPGRRNAAAAGVAHRAIRRNAGTGQHNFAPFNSDGRHCRNANGVDRQR
jgi:hypothetical protein